MGMEGFKPSNPEGRGYKDVLKEDGDRNFVVDEAALQNAETIDLLSRDDVAQIMTELEKPDLHPSLRKTFEMVLKNKGLTVENIELTGDTPTLQ